jgi:hypothetical protein
MSQVLDLRLGDCRIRLREMSDNSVDLVLTDPPYEIGFMTKGWDKSGIAFNGTVWDEIFRVLKPGGKVKVFFGTRTFHRLVPAIKAAGFPQPHLEAWGYGSGFPKSLNVGKAIDKLKGVKRKAKRIPYTGNAVLRSGGQNTRPWMEKALKQGYHELPGDEPATEEAKTWDGWGTAMKPAWEPVLVSEKPV